MKKSSQELLWIVAFLGILSILWVNTPPEQEETYVSGNSGQVTFAQGSEQKDILK